MKTQTKVLYLENFLTDRPCIDSLYYSEERDDKGELMKPGHYVRRATLLSQPENEKVYSLGDYAAVRSETNDWLMCVISEINDPSKVYEEIGLSKKLEKWFPKSVIFTDAPYHPLTIACVIPLMPSILKVYVIK